MAFIAITAAALLVLGVAWLAFLVTRPGPHGSGTVLNLLFLPGVVIIALAMILTVLNGFVAALG